MAKEQNGLDGYILTFILGCGLGAVILVQLTNPSELKHQATQAEINLNNCQASLSEANHQIKGMLMNK